MIPQAQTLDYSQKQRDGDSLRRFALWRNPPYAHLPKMIWQVLFHVVNHGIAHRAQIGAVLRHLRFTPPPQDYIFYVMGRL
ncbi:MAG: DinB family protein [Candidatus Thorarchaeota archaeon SMTZ1-83]|nr:MAG: hypothetical protein AM324_04265 [Candidatus Thorarchaeota archaeon SMTZ1-83]